MTLIHRSMNTENTPACVILCLLQSAVTLRAIMMKTSFLQGQKQRGEEQEVPVRPKTKNSIQVRFDGSHHNKQSNNIGEKASDRVK